MQIDFWFMSTFLDKLHHGHMFLCVYYTDTLYIHVTQKLTNIKPVQEQYNFMFHFLDKEDNSKFCSNQANFFSVKFPFLQITVNSYGLSFINM